jgi:hypothetical protein
MLNTGVMPETREASATDLNADLAEGDRLTAGDLGVLDAVTSASLACGFHAGGPQVMRDTASACVARGVTIGAHVSYRDRDGFGRRVREVSPAELTADLVEQWGVLTTQVHAVGGAVAFVKPHGALYHQMGTWAGGHWWPRPGHSWWTAPGRPDCGWSPRASPTVRTGVTDGWWRARNPGP